MKKLFPLLALIIIIYSCKKEDNGDPITPFGADSGGVYISNEGQFRDGNASVTYFNPANNQVIADAYTQANHESLGDICQSMSMINGKLYLVVNNSGKIEVCDPQNMISSTTISGLKSPRYIQKVNNSKAYVTDLDTNFISIINLDNNLISGRINIRKGTEQMIVKNNLVYITNLFSEYVYVVDANTDLLTDSIHVSVGGSSIAQDINGNLWVICVGDFAAVNAALYKIDPVTKNIEDSIGFPAAQYPSRLCLNPDGDSIYFLNSGIFKMSISDNSLPTTPFITPPGFGFYGLAVDKKKNIIYASDPVDYTQRGSIYRYTANGVLINNFLAGIVPGDFLFLE